MWSNAVLEGINNVMPKYKLLEYYKNQKRNGSNLLSAIMDVSIPNHIMQNVSEEENKLIDKFIDEWVLEEDLIKNGILPKQQ